jgi:hypothetical protein
MCRSGRLGEVSIIIHAALGKAERTAKPRVKPHGEAAAVIVEVDGEHNCP